MREMRDAVDARDASALAREIATEGYVLLRGLVNPDAAKATGDDIHAVLMADGWVSNDATAVPERVPTKGAESDEYWTTYAKVLALESLNRLGWDPSVESVMRSLLGDDAFQYPMKTPRLVFPRCFGGVSIPAHRDNRGGPWVADMFTVWVALEHITTELGGLAVLRGSQTYRYGPIIETATADVFPGLPLPDDASDEWVTTEYAPGDTVIFHCYTLHKGMPNCTDRVRVSADYRWQRAGQPVHVSVLLPYHYFDKQPHIPGWSQLTTDWVEARWHERPANLDVLYEKWPARLDSTVPQSEFVTVTPGSHEAWRGETRDPTPFMSHHELPPTLGSWASTRAIR